MKTIRYAAFSAMIGLLVLASACKKETTPLVVTQSGSKILVTGQDAGTGLKSTLSAQSTVWVAGSDKVGIYSAEARTSSSVAIVNIPFTAATSAASSTFSSDPETMSWGATNSSHTFYAYYPWVTGTSASNAVPVSLASAQTQSAANSSAHIGALDFMVATPATVTSPDTPGMVGSGVNLYYNHLFTVLEFQIIRSSGSGKITRVRLTAPTTNLSLTSGTVNITSATPGAGVSYTISSPSGTKEITLTITGGVTPTSDYATTPKIYMMILPGDFSAENMTIGLEYESSGVFINTTKTGKIFERGTKYVVQMEYVTDFHGYIYNTVTSTTTPARIWLDRNLGATQVATSSTDAASYGDLYQWGRAADGHQIRTSVTTSTLSSSDAPGNVGFILAPASPYDWRNPQNVNLWQGLTGINNPCPSGFRLPTETEFSAEMVTWGSSPNAARAFGSPLKFAAAGSRNYSSGSLEDVGSFGCYWSSTIQVSTYSIFLYFSSNQAYTSNYYRAFGYSVRCIKD
ncbi:MAG: fimbrillin family protein [Prolixibacteraceae bacterium]